MAAGAGAASGSDSNWEGGDLQTPLTRHDAMTRTPKFSVAKTNILEILNYRKPYLSPIKLVIKMSDLVEKLNPLNILFIIGNGNDCTCHITHHRR